MAGKPKAFTAAMKEFFGYLPGQGLKAFGDEVKALSFEEKKEFHKMLLEQAIECSEPKS